MEALVVTDELYHVARRHLHLCDGVDVASQEVCKEHAPHVLAGTDDEHGARESLQQEDDLGPHPAHQIRVALLAAHNESPRVPSLQGSQCQDGPRLVPGLARSSQRTRPLGLAVGAAVRDLMVRWDHQLELLGEQCPSAGCTNEDVDGLSLLSFGLAQQCCKDARLDLLTVLPALRRQQDAPGSQVHGVQQRDEGRRDERGTGPTADDLLPAVEDAHAARGHGHISILLRRIQLRLVERLVLLLVGRDALSEVVQGGLRVGRVFVVVVLELHSVIVL
mmetsp:Transcript_2744/g.6270  ORF Transcript_2744/g.6270 Transcript_2744/m.6270 type:complete len:277 (+) Transcript_2744:166-996(+)